MSEPSSDRDVFDVQHIRRLVELMNEHDLNEMDLRQGDMRIQLRRGAESSVALPAVAASHPAPAASASSAESRSHAAPVPSDTPADEEYIALITSPMVGTFYASPDPAAEPYVAAGDLVSADTTVCIVEAMKVFNEIQAEVSGRVVGVLVESGEPVEFGQPMFKIDTRQ